MTAQRERAAGRAWTPGPWEVDGLYVTAGDPSTGATIADCWKSSRLSHVEKKANARLIAAAPELFEAASALIACDTAENWNALRAALSRAGEVEHG